MSDPLEILDKIDREGGFAHHIHVDRETDLPLIRAAIETQSERIKWLEAQVEAAIRFDAIAESEELAQARARIARLERAAINVTECLAGQVPMFLEELEAVIQEEPEQSLAAVKAEALHTFGDKLFAEQISNPNQDFARLAHDEADRIEQEAKEQS